MNQLLLRDLAVAKSARPARAAARQPEAAVAGRLQLALVDSLAGFDALAADWTDLFGTIGQPQQVFQAYNWCWHWCRHYLGDGHGAAGLAIVTGRIDGRLALVLPLAVQKRAGLRELTWLGEPVSQYGDILAAPEARHPELLNAAWRFALSSTRADVVNLRKVRADSVACALLDRLGATRTATEEAPFLDLSQDASFEAWEARRQPKGRRNRQRQARRLAETGVVRLQQHVGTPDSARLAAHAVTLKRESLAAKGAIAPTLSDARFGAFFADVAEGLGRPAGARVSELRSAETPAALKVLLDNGTATCLHIAVFDPAFEKCGAGAVLLEHTIRQAIADGRHTLDLLAPRHGYKMDFADGVVLVHDYALAVSARGWLYAHGFLRVRRQLKAVVEALPFALRRRLARATCQDGNERAAAPANAQEAHS